MIFKGENALPPAPKGSPLPSPGGAEAVSIGALF